MPGLLRQEPEQGYHIFERPIESVAVVGAGPSGLPAARHLHEAGFRVRVFERQPYAGGTWTFEPDLPLQPKYPSVPPSIGDFVPSLPPENAEHLPFEKVQKDENSEERKEFSPPNPVYQSLTNNVPTPCMEFKDFPWPEGTEWHVSHTDISKYIQSYAVHFGLNEFTSYRTRVENISQLDPPPGQSQPRWRLTLRRVEDAPADSAKSTWWTEDFDAVVVASGHYGAPFIPKIEGVEAWAERWKDDIIHSRAYRSAEDYTGKTVLIVGTGTSGVDIARDISPHVTKIYQVRRNQLHGPDHYQRQRSFQLKMLPANGEHLPEIKRFLPLSGAEKDLSECRVECTDGRVVGGFDKIIFATGYQYSVPFLSDYHLDPNTLPHSPHQAPDRVLVTSGAGVSNLLRDVFYIPQPTLAFLGLSINTATFSFFEFQGLAITRVWQGWARLPDERGRRKEYERLVEAKGGGRFMHLMGHENEVAYVRETVDWLNADGARVGAPLIEGHSERWLEVKKSLFAALLKKAGLDPKEFGVKDDGEPPARVGDGVDGMIDPGEVKVQKDVERGGKPESIEHAAAANGAPVTVAAAA
ncbi:FAD/NADP-binding domain-containing protein [Dacryopinax primogenitus]|uniref:FAD/NADP-binding domain-containing protein n=1 Tax=Dacryopinax primogenitus (strain DJM 731) TaxID=1858805 RepID=M5FQ76_DACPD|nr:FAD/NADP-binding domain-containing protein [Dacryopinax primogenitus]EJT99010.1 FAD/NADP-binding domain-containing protein [Dacryopinax primogenitus]